MSIPFSVCWMTPFKELPIQITFPPETKLDGALDCFHSPKSCMCRKEGGWSFPKRGSLGKQGPCAQYRHGLDFPPSTTPFHLHKSLEVITLGFGSWVDSGEMCRCITRLRSYSLLFYPSILVIWVANLKRTITTKSLFSSIQSHDCVKRQTQWRILGK